MSFGFGKKLHSDFTNELKGYIPDTTLYDRVYGQKGWSSLTVYSLAIGQGELGTTPLQMANMTAAIANRGSYYTPHVVKNIEGELDIDDRYKEKHHTLIDSAIFEPIIDGMELAVNGGAGSTAWRGKIPGITVCGKTGTAENPHGKDHSIFVAFAPKENPRIAISTYVENAGYGSTYAVPIARLMIEKYLKDTITQPYLEKYILDANLLDRRETER
jgi:penicillin-binding protein 2